MHRLKIPNCIEKDYIVGLNINVLWYDVYTLMC